MNILVLSEHELLRGFVTKFFQSLGCFGHVKSLNQSKLGFWRALKRYELVDFEFDHIVVDLDSRYLTTEEQLLIVSRMESRSIFNKCSSVTYIASEPLVDELSNIVSLVNSTLQLKPINANQLKDIMSTFTRY